MKNNQPIVVPDIYYIEVSIFCSSNSYTMKSFLFFVFLSILGYSSLLSQPCLPDGITLTTQSEIDNFKTNNPGCTEIGGSLIIYGDDITNLNGLNGIVSVGFDLNITYTTNLSSLSGLESIRKSSLVTIVENTGLQSLTGLSGLDSIHFTLAISKNLMLINLEGLNSLKFISNTFNVIDNPQLSSLHGLDSLEFIGGLFMKGNPALFNLQGMPMLNTIDYNLALENTQLHNLTGLENINSINQVKIFFNPSLSSLSGLDGLTNVLGTMEIKGNATLNSLEGLNSLAFVQDDVLIIGNSGLLNIEALNALERAGTSLDFSTSIEISGNGMLSSLNGLDNIDLSESPFLTFSIYTNSVLSDCTIDPFCHSTPPTSIFDNAPGCNSMDEIKVACLVDITDLESEPTLILNPNPVHDVIRFEGIDLADTEIVLLDTQGKYIATRKTVNNELRMDNIDPGLYFIFV